MGKNWSDTGKSTCTLKPWHGMAMFLVVMASFYTIIAWMQGKWGMYGLALTELYLLVLSIAGAKLLKQPLKTVFPVKKPEGKKLLAVVLFWISSYALVIPLTMLVAYFYPKEMFSVSGNLNAFISSVPPLLALLISSVLPAMCEEAVHRGFILKSMQSRFHNVWGLTIFMGILFGLFHGSVWRFLPTALLGGVLSYLMIRTENMIYPGLFQSLLTIAYPLCCLVFYQEVQIQPRRRQPQNSSWSRDFLLAFSAFILLWLALYPLVFILQIIC